VSAAIVAWSARGLAHDGVTTPRAAWPDGPDRLGRMDRPAAWALVNARAVAASLGRGDDVGVIVGTALGCADVNARYHRGIVTQGPAAASPMLFAQTLPSTPAGEAAITFGMRGHSATVMAGRASGIAAVAEALRALRSGRLRAALVLAGDVIGPDDLSLRTARGAGPAAPGFVALGLVRDDDAPPAAPRLLEASVRGGGVVREVDDLDALGASGLLALARWLDAGDDDFVTEVRCPSGRVGTLRATRRRGC
jgi:Beta-ketoacyl synthase, N-terminal domain